MLTHLILFFYLHTHLQVFDVLGMCTRDRIDEVLRVIDGLMDVSLRQICDAVVGRPLIAVDRGARGYELLDHRNEGISISLID